MASYVYLITHRDSGKCYVGKTNNPKGRWKSHKKVARRGDPRPLYCALRKYGFDAFDFEVIEEHSTEQDAYEAEAFFVEYLRGLGAQLYNLNDGVKVA